VRLLPDGALYAGEVLDSLRHGGGAQRWPDGHVYSGEWFKDKRHGRGLYRFSGIVGPSLEDNCDRYDGQWSAGFMHGWGIYSHKTGDVYEGEFAENEMCGRGTYTHADGTQLQGMLRLFAAVQVRLMRAQACFPKASLSVTLLLSNAPP
jgi:hypothetical protein